MDVEDADIPVDNNDADDFKHAQLIENVISLSKTQHIKKPVRTEPTLNISEFNLVSSITGSKGFVHLNDLTSVLRHRAKHVEIGKKLLKTNRKSSTLKKPLEKPQAERIRRSVGYSKAKDQLDKWEAVVTANRASLDLSFPLNNDLEFKKEDESNYGFRIKSELQKKLEATEKKYEEYVIEPEVDTKFTLTLGEIMERRREVARVRAHQSYKEAKARRQNRIKSKKYHRIERREKMKQKMKEFELLQKTDPEEALKKLEEIEKARAEERVTLRHRSTGQWARSKQVRAKYDKESRQVLAQQLAVSRDLTQKLKADSDSDADVEEDKPKSALKPTDPNNPWVSGIKTNEEIDSFIESYKKYWNERNKSQEVGNEDAVKGNEEISEVEVQEDMLITEDLDQMNGLDVNTKTVSIGKIEDSLTPLKRKKQKIKSKDKKKIKVTKVECASTSDWNIVDINEEVIDDVFDNLQDRVEKKLLKRASSIIISQETDRRQLNKNRKENNNIKKVDLSFPRQVKRPVIDEELIENTAHEKVADSTKPNNKDFGILSKILDDTQHLKGSKGNAEDNIDPNKIIDVKTVSLNTQLPDMLTVDENEENVDQMAGISEAFEDDDIVDEFDKEKADEIAKSQPKDVDLTLPGWGSWGGKDIKVPRKKRRRFMIKFPKKPVKKDENKGKLIINEDANKKVKEHLVSEVPFPFQTVKDFEASIRAPIGNTFIPETAFRKLIKPAVRTKMGTIIQPMSEDILLRKYMDK